MRENTRVSNPYAPPTPDRLRPRVTESPHRERTVPRADQGTEGGSPPPTAPPDPHPQPGVAPRETEQQRSGGEPTADAGWPGPQRPGTPFPGTVAPTPSDPEVLARISRLVRHFGVWLVAAVAMSLLPLPWRVATIAFLLGAGVTGIRALRAVVVAKVRGGLATMLIAGLAMTGVLAAGALGSLVLWSADSARQDCLRGALTQSAQAACEQQYQDAVQKRTDDLTGRIGGP